MALRMTGLVSGMDTESMVEELMKAQRTKSTKIENKITKLEWTQEIWKTLNTKIYSFYTGVLSKAKMESTYMTKKATSSNAGKVEVSAGPSVPEGTHKIKVEAVASAQFVTGTQLGKDLNNQDITRATKLVDIEGITEGSKIIYTVGGMETEFTVEAETTVSDLTNALSDAGLNANFDNTYKRLFISSKKSGLENKFGIRSEGDIDLSELGLNQITIGEDGSISETGTADMELIKPADAIIYYNGVKLTGSSNSITVNGLTLTLKGITEGLGDSDPNNDEEISITINNDTEAVYNTIKEFIKSYNELLKEMNEDYYADSSRGYDPLTDEQKEAMSDDEVEKWEKKIRDSLLRRDNNLDSVLNAMKNKMSQKVSVNGKSFSLTSFGIGAIDYTEKGILHINGDEDDTLVAIEDNDLKKALNENPDAVMEVFTKLAGDLYDTMTEQMKRTELSSALTFYNDKEIKDTLDDYKDELSDMEQKLADMEERYYKQFASMETALQKLNSQSSSLMSLLGMNTGQQ